MRMFKVHLIFGLFLLLGVSSQKDEDEGRPYEFSFTIDGEQHRYEKKDVNGIIQGEFGFITGDGVYHVTVYATDENGSFKILSMKNTKISEPLDRGGKPSTAGLVRQPASAQQSTGGVPPKPAPPKPAPPVGQPPPAASKPSPPIAQPPPPSAPPTAAAVRPVQPSVTTSRTPYDFTTASTIRNGCSGCGIVTKAPPGPLNFQNPTFKKSGKAEQKPPTQPGQPLSNAKQAVPASKPPSSGPINNDKPIGLVSKSFSPAGESSNYPSTPAGPSISIPSVPANIDKSSGLISKPFVPAGESSNYPSTPAGPSISIPSVPANIDKPSGLVSKPFVPTGESSNYPSPPSGPAISIPNGPANTAGVTGQPAPPQTILLAPGTNPAPTGSSAPAEQNPYRPSPVNKPAPVNILAPSPAFSQSLPGPAQNQIPGNPALSPVTVSNGVINVPGNEPIPIKDKYPNMVDGLPEGINERDITDLLYKFNYTVGFHGHYEKGLKNGAKVGGYFVNGRDGISRVVTYIADENGYRPKFKLINLGLESEDTPKPDSEKKFGLKNFEFIWYPLN